MSIIRYGAGKIVDEIKVADQNVEDGQTRRVVSSRTINPVRPEQTIEKKNNKGREDTKI